MAGAFLANLLGLLAYQLVGAGLFLCVEIMFPKSTLSIAERTSGLIFLIATALLTAVVGTGLLAVRDALHIVPVVSLKSSFGGPILAAIALALWVDFQFYVLHRLEHRFLWRFHAVHHSIKNLSAANSYHHWTEAFWVTLAVTPLMFADVQIGPTLGALTFLFRYQQFYIHSASAPHFGPLRRVLVDNRYHRIHHSMDPAHHDKNFGAMTPLWDWLFGTLYMPRSNEWPAVGLKEADEPRGLWPWIVFPWRLENAPLLQRHEGDDLRALRGGQRAVNHEH